MLMPKIWHLLEQFVLCPLVGGQSTKPFAAASPSTCSFVFLTRPSVQAQHEPCTPCGDPRSAADALGEIWQLSKRELQKRQKYLKTQRKPFSNTLHSCCRINEVPIIFFQQKSHNVQFPSPDPKERIFHYLLHQWKVFSYIATHLESCSSSATEYGLSFISYFESQSCTAFE